MASSLSPRSRSISIRGIIDTPSGETSVRLVRTMSHADMHRTLATMCAEPSTADPPEI